MSSHIERNDEGPSFSAQTWEGLHFAGTLRVLELFLTTIRKRYGKLDFDKAVLLRFATFIGHQHIL